MDFNPQSQEDETSIELTPLIDVVFLLLIFFMISTTFTKETALKINLPESVTGESSDEPTTIEVQIAGNGDYALLAQHATNAQALVNQNRATLIQALSEEIASQDIMLVIRADRQADHAAVIKVMDVAQELGISNLTFAAERSE